MTPESDVGPKLVANFVLIYFSFVSDFFFIRINKINIDAMHCAYVATVSLFLCVSGLEVRKSNGHLPLITLPMHFAMDAYL